MKDFLLDTATIVSAWVVTIVFVAYLFVYFIVDYSETGQ